MAPPEKTKNPPPRRKEREGINKKTKIESPLSVAHLNQAPAAVLGGSPP